MSRCSRPRRTQAGLTIIELLVAMSVATLIALSLIGILLHVFTTHGNATKQMVLAQETQTALATIARDVRYTGAFLQEPSIEDVDAAAAPGGGWDFEGESETSRQLILETYATSKAYQDQTNDLIFRTSPAADCDTRAAYLMLNVIYYVEEEILYRRTVVPADANTCPEPPFQKQTCKHTDSHDRCQETDVVIARNVTNFTAEYYTNPYDPEPIEDVYSGERDANFLRPARSVRVSLTVQDTAVQQLEAESITILLSKGNM